MLQKWFLIVIMLILSVLLVDGTWTFFIDNLDAPASITYDPSGKNYYVTNINGIPGAEDNNGYVSVIDENGVLKNKKFVKGGNNITLNSPMGIIVVGDLLYICDINVIHVVNKDTGYLAFDLAVDGAKYLCDIVVGPYGNMFVSDTTNNTIYKISNADYNTSIYVHSNLLSGPTGLTFTPDNSQLIVGSWNSGKIFSIWGDKRVTVKYSLNFGKVYSLAYDNKGNLYIAAYNNNTIHKIDRESNVILFNNNVNTPGDIYVDTSHKILLIPSLTGNYIRTCILNTY